MRRAPPPNPVVVATESTLPARLTRSKMARKPVSAGMLSVAASATAANDDSTPTPSTDGYADPLTPATVKVKGSVTEDVYSLHTRQLLAHNFSSLSPVSLTLDTIQYNERFVRRRSTNRRGAPYNNNNKSVRTIKQNSFKSFLEYISVGNVM